jgi:hypothetical protein
VRRITQNSPDVRRIDHRLGNEPAGCGKKPAHLRQIPQPRLATSEAGDIMSCSRRSYGPFSAGEGEIDVVGEVPLTRLELHK